MPNLSEYIVPSSDVQINMTFSGIPSMKLDTGSRLNWANSQCHVPRLGHDAERRV